ncbi:MAG: CAP domain-containing protein [Pseudotabrizicola sp.]|uniref:CAP domain-containing protein n=1 Tax=Pseudotabrizicola sp. TaxID=2939647 RepID=UPI002715F849|nr:CAP domain-containing protein [Pseudotabrizicola sp.]MDO8884896.1 CAP domain-containing protein [Pseudotabrizicola sp.]MDP2081328.1 CAP domain-containing protein [Pseudotabrizicola sp.]MDZ7576053.1 CAP domain-containing protein [Pseudotabrizicola sp.]
MNPSMARQCHILPPTSPGTAQRGLRLIASLAAIVVLSACAQLNPNAPPRLDATGASVQGVYPVTERNIGQVRSRAVDTVNQTRLAGGLAPVALDPALIQSADGHSRSMSQQGRAWSFGADGSTSIDRARRAGFDGRVLGELISETYETEVQAIETWMQTPATRAILLDPRARRIGLGVFQEPSNKLWWTLTVAN